MHGRPRKPANRIFDVIEACIHGRCWSTNMGAETIRILDSTSLVPKFRPLLLTLPYRALSDLKHYYSMFKSADQIFTVVSEYYARILPITYLSFLSITY